MDGGGGRCGCGGREDEVLGLPRCALETGDCMPGAGGHGAIFLIALCTSELELVYSLYHVPALVFQSEENREENGGE